MSRIYGVNANRTDINKTEYLKLAGNCKENKIQGGNCPMKKSRSFIHYGKVLLIFAILMLVPFTGCKNIFVPEPPATPEAAGSGGGITVTLRLFTGSARTVMPEYTETGSLNWKITASQGETAVEASGEYPNYTLSLPSAAEWIFNVTGLNNEGDEIFTGSVSMEITGTTATVSIPLSPGSAMTTGTGKIILTLTVPDTVEKVMYKLGPDEGFSGLTPGSNNTCTLEKESIPAGTHTLSLYFLDGDNTTLYMCKETVNVWGGMTSDQWINTGNSAYINDEGEFKLTEDIITAFLKTMGSVVYVDGDSGSDDSDGVGSIFAPVASVSKAVEILRKANTEANYRATIMVSGETTIDQEIEVKNGETLTVKGTGEDASITNTSGRIFNITGGSVTLGENITLTGTVTDDNGGAVYVAENGTFTMNDGSKITGSSAKYKSINCNGGAVYVAGGTFTMEAGSKITGSSATGHTSSYGGAVFIYKGTFNMNGGVIGGSEEEKNTAVCGGGVYVFTDGIFNMSGNAKIQGNEATGTDESSGGGVYVNGGEFSMKGSAIIQGNKAATTGDSVQYGGGGVYVNGGKFTMTGKAEIKDNHTTGKSGTGGGVHIWYANFTMGDNTCIESNSTEYGGGGVYLGNSSTFTMSGDASIMSNNVKAVKADGDAYGGGVSVNTNSSFTIDKDSSISIKNNTIEGKKTYGGGVFVNKNLSCKFTVNGNPIITGNKANSNVNNNVYLSTGKTITIGEGGLTGGTIGVTAGTITPGGAEQITAKDVKNAAEIFTSDVEGYRIVENVKVGGGSTAVFLSDTETTYSTGENGGVSLGDFDDAFKAIEDTGGDITVYDTVQITGETAISPSENVTINITASGATTVFDVQADGSLTLGGGDGEVNVSGDPSASSPTADGKEISLINISNGGTVTIEKNANIQNNQAGRGVTVDNGRLIMTGGSIKGNTGGYSYGSGVYVSGSTAEFKMSGGEIRGNELKLGKQQNRQGAGVMVCNGATFTLSDSGKITDNSGYEGVGVTVSGSTFNMKGGEISNNEGMGTSGGVYLVSSATMNMNGGTITGNKAKMSSGAGGVYIGLSCNFTGSTDSTTASITENYVGSSNVDVYFQSGGNVTYSPGNVQVGNPQNPKPAHRFRFQSPGNVQVGNPQNP